MKIRTLFDSIREYAHTVVENKKRSKKEYSDMWWATWREKRKAMPNYELMREKTRAENVLSTAVIRSTHKYKHNKRLVDECSAIFAERRASGLFIPEPQQQRQYVIHQPTAAKRVTQTKIVRQEPEKTKRRRIRLGIGIGFWF